MALLFSEDGRIVRRVPVPPYSPFVLNMRDGLYYDYVQFGTYVLRTDEKFDPLKVECPTCGSWTGWACGKSHVDPIHRARIVLALRS